LEKIFHAPLWFQWKAVTRERHAPKFCHACHAWKSLCHARYLVDNCHVSYLGAKFIFGLPVKGGAPQIAELGCGGLMTKPEWKKVALQKE